MRINETRAVAKMLEGGSGTEVIANPELAGDEAALTGLEVAGTKYKVGGGSGSEYAEIKGMGDYWDEDQWIEITNEDDIATFNNAKADYLANGTIPKFYYTDINSGRTLKVCLDTYEVGESEPGAPAGLGDFDIYFVQIYTIGECEEWRLKYEEAENKWYIRTKYYIFGS